MASSLRVAESQPTTILETALLLLYIERQIPRAGGILALDFILEGAATSTRRRFSSTSRRDWQNKESASVLAFGARMNDLTL
jgi:hypothetical protein